MDPPYFPITYIGAYACAGCVNLNSIGISEGLETVREHAFDGCTSLVQCNLPASLLEIKDYAFNGCTAITNLYFAGTMAKWENVRKSENWSSGANIVTVVCSDGAVSL
jgi:hypothetical protein